MFTNAVRTGAVLAALAVFGCGDNADDDGPLPGECGDGVVAASEACDDGAANSDTLADACRTSCELPSCGDGVIDSSESCDDGPGNSDTGACRTNCALATCGDGIVDTGEDCDDGADNSDTVADACRTTCVAPRCGDGTIDLAAGEHCDLGADNTDDPGSACLTTCRGLWKFVSMPDFLNYDIGDVSALSAAVTSTNAFHEQAIATVLDAIAAENPDFVLVAGDLVGGHWHTDADGVKVFGPVGTIPEKAAAVALAADTYYPQWLERFAARGIPVHAAIGDHDIGDNPWPASFDRSQLVDDFKAAWAKHLTKLEGGEARYVDRPTGTAFEDTAYAFRHKNMLVVSADVFHHQEGVDLGPQGTVALEVTAEQLDWMNQVFAAAAADPEIEYLVVQGHVPVIKPVRFQSSSNLGLAGGSTSAFWQALVAAGVDLYLSGEVHAMSSRNVDGVEQISHGGLMGSPNAQTVSYLVGSVYPDRMELELESIDITYNAANTNRLWQAGNNRPFEELVLDEAGFTIAGTLVVDHAGETPVLRGRTGYFLPFQQQPPPGLLVHLPFDEGTAGETPNRGLSTLVHRGVMTGGSLVAGKLGNAVKLATGERVVAGPTPISSNWARTISAWVKPTAAEAGLTTVLTFGRNTSGGKWDLDIDHTNGGVVELGVAGGRTNSSGTTSVTDGQWHHIVTLLPAGGEQLGDVRIFVDGEPIVSTAAKATAIATVAELADQNATAPSAFIIGHAANSAGFQQYSGEIDDVAVWSRSLGGVEIRALVSLATTAGLAYDAGQAEALLAAFAGQRDVTIGALTWTYRATGLTGPEGVVVEPAPGQYELNLGGGAGLVTP